MSWFLRLKDYEGSVPVRNISYSMSEVFAMKGCLLLSFYICVRCTLFVAKPDHSENPKPRLLPELGEGARQPGVCTD